MTRSVLASLFLLIANVSFSQAQQGCGGIRLVSLEGSLTEIVYALGAGDCLVAVDATATYPPEARELPQVGYHRTLNAEGVMALAPTLIIGTSSAGPPAALDVLRQTGITLRIIEEPGGLEEVTNKIAAVAELLGRKERGAALIARIEADVDALRAAFARADNTPDVLFLLGQQSGAPLAAGAGTTAHSFLELLRAANVFESAKSWKPLTIEAAVEASPDVILVASHLVETDDPAEYAAGIPGLAATPAVQNGRLHLIDSSLVLGFGPRLPQALRRIGGLIYPDLSMPELGSRASGG